MPAIKPRIIHKATILLVVPLVFEIIAATTLLVLQNSYSQAVKAEALRTEIVYRTKELWSANISLTTSSLGTALMGSTLRAQTIEKKFRQQYTALTQLLGDHPQQLQQLQEIGHLHEELRILGEELTQSLGNKRSQLQNILALSRNLKTWESLIAKDMQAGDLIRSLTEHELQQSTSASDRARFFAGLIQLVLAGVIVGSTLIAYLLFRFFMRGIHKGVQALMLNIQRFKSGESLAPVVEGADELALLDSRFHDMAEEVGAAQLMKQAFVNTVSYELSIPISSTRNDLTQLCSGAFGAISEAANDRAQKAQVSMGRLMALFNDLLALQASGTRQMEIVPRPCSLDEIIRNAIDAIYALAEKNNVRLETANTDITAYADPDRIVQVLVNLLSNAIKFSPTGAPVIISAAPVADQVEIRVTDIGRGVPAHLRDAIFERFQQVESSDATQKGGTGLGLPICKEIVRLHSGKIGVESEEGKGSTFWIRLPVQCSAKTKGSRDALPLAAAPSRRKRPFIAPRTIYAKGLILISIPLLVELAFGGTLFALQRYYQAKLNRERVAVEILFRVNEMWINSTEFLLLKAQYTLFGGSKSPIDAKIARFSDEYNALKKLAADDPRHQSLLDDIKTKVDRILAVCERLQPVNLTNLSLGNLQLLKSDLRLFSQARTAVSNLYPSRIGLKQYVNREARVNDLNIVTERVNMLVLGSLATSALVAVLLFVYFMRSINQEIRIIVKNTDRFKQGLELEPPMGGGDELTQVDAAFHQMSAEIKQAQLTKQKIVSMISHDLRSPLVSVLGFLSNFTVGVFGDPPEEALSHVQNCERDIERVIRLINDLLDLDKMDAGKFELRTRALSADQVMDEAINRVFSLADESDVNINLPVGSAQLYGDPDRVVQALANILSTAVRLSPAGSSIETSVGQDDDQAQMWITATNAQLTEDQLNSLFDRYQQTGTGLRLELPISKEIVRLHGGTIGVTTVRPQGLTFLLHWPSQQPKGLLAANPT